MISELLDVVNIPKDATGTPFQPEKSLEAFVNDGLVARLQSLLTQFVNAHFPLQATVQGVMELNIAIAGLRAVEDEQ